MNQITFDLLTKICDKCGGRCCYYAKPPLTEERISILVENGISLDNVVFREHRMLDCKSTGFCVGYSEGRCRVQHVKPETCMAGPFTFDVKNGKLEIYLKKDRICDLVTFLKVNPAVYNEQFELAVQNIRQLVRPFPRKNWTVCARWRSQRPRRSLSSLCPRCYPTTVGTEHEYSVNNAELAPQPVVDRIIEDINGEIINEFRFGDINLSKELQKNVIELVPATPHTSIARMEAVLYGGMQRFHQATNNKYTLLGLGMHPLLTLDQTSYWNHEDQEIYDIYNDLFDLKQHGWLNIQALQINVHYESEDKMVSMFNRMRALIPYLVAVTASSPFVEGNSTSSMDNRLVFYRQNQERVPLICNQVIPEKLGSRQHHDEIIESIYRDLRKIGGEELCHEWIDSRGVIVRYHRECLELKACDEQECLHSDMAVTAFVLALLRAPLNLEDDHDSLLDMNEEAIRRGTSSCRPELLRLYWEALRVATPEERRYLPLIKRRIEQGSIAEHMARQVKEGECVRDVAKKMAVCLRNNDPYQA